jgi:hypothetical protein
VDVEQRQALLEAVNLLIASPKAHQLYETVEGVAHLAARYPVRLANDADGVNALLDLRVKDQQAYERVIELIEGKRASLGYDPLRSAKEGYNKTQYMREFMEQKRERERLAVEIENMLRGDKNKLVGMARLEFMRRQSARWKEQRDAFLERAKEKVKAPALSKDQMRAALAQFWQAVDEELEIRHKQVKTEMLKPTNKRQQPDIQLDTLLAALEFDPYKQ